MLSFFLSPTFAQLWLALTAVFELPLLFQVATQGASVASARVRRAHKSDSNKEGVCSAAYSRLYFTFLLVLTLTRACFLVDVESGGSALLACVIHLAEAGFFGAEAMLAPGGLRRNLDVILLVIFAQGLWYVTYCGRVLNMY